MIYSNKKIIVLFSIIIYSVTSCSMKESYSQSDVPCIKIEIDINNLSYLTSEHVVNKKIIPLEITDKSIIGEITKLLVANDRIFILDSRVAEGLYVFDMQGKFQFAIDQKGQGPGEFYTINDFFVDTLNQCFSIYDANWRKLNYYDWNGKYIRSHSLSQFWLHACYPFDERVFALDFTKRALRFNRFHLLMVNDENKIFFSFKPLKTDYGLSNKNHIAFYQGYEKVFYVPTGSDIIYELSNSGIERGIQVDFGKNKLPQNFFNDYPHSQHAIKLLTSKYCSGIKDIVETSEMLSFQYLFGNRGCVAFFDKKNQHVYNGIYFFPPPMASYQESFVGIFDAHIISSFFGEIAKNHPADFNSWISAMGDENVPLLSNVKEDDNPLVIIYSIDTNAL